MLRGVISAPGADAASVVGSAASIWPNLSWPRSGGDSSSLVSSSSSSRSRRTRLRVIAESDLGRVNSRCANLLGNGCRGGVPLVPEWEGGGLDSGSGRRGIEFALTKEIRGLQDRVLCAAGRGALSCVCEKGAAYFLRVRVSVVRRGHGNLDSRWWLTTAIVSLGLVEHARSGQPTSTRKSQVSVQMAANAFDRGVLHVLCCGALTRKDGRTPEPPCETFRA